MSHLSVNRWTIDPGRRCAAALLALFLLLSQGCTSTDSRPIYSPDTVTQHKIDTGFTGDLGVGPTLGHSVPVEGEVISTPRCVSEVRAGRECKN